MVRLRPEDATLRFQYARHLKEAGDTSAAIEQYKTAIETDASVYFMNGWYDVLPVFQTADRLDDLTKLLEKDHSEAVDYEEVHQLLQALLANSKYHGAAVSLLKATMSKGGYVPGTTFGSLLRDLTPKFLELPETEQIVRDEVIPVGIDLVKDNPWFGVNPELPKLLTVSAERGRLGRLGQDASTVSRKWPEWLGGKVLLKLIDLRLGRVEGVGDAIGTLVAANDPPMNSGARAAIARELAAVAELQDLALRLAEQGVERQDTKGGMFGQMSNYAGPTQLLVDLYYKTGHEAKARSTAMNYFRSVLPRQNDSSSVATNQLFNIAVLVGQHLLKIDDPLDALRVFATYQGRTGSSARKGQFVQSIDGELARALAAVKGASPEDILNDLIPAKGKDQPAVDLMILIYPRALDRIEMVSVLDDALHEAAALPGLLPRVRERIGRLRVRDPQVLATAIAECLAALAVRAEDPTKSLAALERLIAEQPIAAISPASRPTAHNGSRRPSESASGLSRVRACAEMNIETQACGSASRRSKRHRGRPIPSWRWRSFASGDGSTATGTTWRRRTVAGHGCSPSSKIRLGPGPAGKRVLSK